MDLLDSVNTLNYEEKTSKAGKQYKCIVLELANGYKKLIFLNQAESYMLDELVINK